MHDRSTVGWTQKAHDDDVVVVVVALSSSSSFLLPRSILEDKVVIKVSRLLFFKKSNELFETFFLPFFFLEKNFVVCSFLGFVVSKKMGAQKKMGKSNRKKKELSRSSIRGSPLKYHSQKKKEPIHSSVPDPKKASKKEEARARGRKR